jgi:hypothetical protein
MIVKLKKRNARYRILTSGFGLTLLVAGTAAQSQSLWGIKVGDPPSVLEKINLEPLFREGTGPIKIVKYRLANGNELSVIYNSRENRIIYIENDWPIAHFFTRRVTFI